jgi:hypothetical protein
MPALLGAVTLGRFLLTLGCEHAVGVQDGGGTCALTTRLVLDVAT